MMFRGIALAALIGVSAASVSVKSLEHSGTYVDYEWFTADWYTQFDCAYETLYESGPLDETW